MEKGAKIVFFISALTSIVAVVLICLFLFANGLPAILEIGSFKFLLGGEWSPQDVPPSFGILPMILGSIYITIGAIVVGVPTGILTAVFMEKFCPKKWANRLKPLLSLLAGIPSIVYGFFGMVIIVPMVRFLFGGNGNSMLSASVLLGVMILPTIIEISWSAIRAVPSSYYEGALALGATHEKAVFFATLPAAASGLMAAVTLGIGRAIGETMAVVMVAGNQAVVRMPNELLKGVRTLTANIITEMGYAEGLHREALISTGLVLFIFILLINFAFAILKRRALK